MEDFVLWLYLIPTWLLAILIFVAIGGGSVLGLLICRRWFIRRPHKGNDLVFNFVASAGVVYALVLGLIAVATWENFKSVEEIVSQEAFALSDLYADAGGLDDHTRVMVQQDIREYLHLVIDKEWPAQIRGRRIEDGAPLANRLEADMLHANTSTDREKIVQAQALLELNNFLGRRRARRQALDDSLPGVLYFLVLVGAGLLIMMTYVLWTEEVVLQLLLTLALAAMISLVVLLIVSMDHPLWGQISVSPEPYKNLLDAIGK